MDSNNGYSAECDRHFNMKPTEHLFGCLDALKTLISEIPETFPEKRRMERCIDRAISWKPLITSVDE